MSLITAAQLKRVCIGKTSASQNSNMNSFIVAINDYGEYFGMDKLYNLSSYIGQAMVESGEFKYDQEIWGPTAQQKKYDTGPLAKTLGNTPAADGDGKLHKGYGPFQVTGAGNQKRYYEWALANHTAFGAPVPPNFYKDPKKIITDPWEGLSALWYWHVGNPEHVSLNKYAAENNQLMVTKRVNGGTTAYDRRLEYQSRAALVLLGYGVTKAEIERFQKEHQPEAGNPDGIIGDKTRDALHVAMKGEVRPAQVKTVEKKVEVKVPVKVAVPTPVPVKVESLEKPWYKDLDGISQAGGGVVVTSAVGFLTDADTMKIVVIAAIMAVGFGIWYGIRRSKAKAQEKEVQRINQVAPAAAELAKVTGV